MTPPDVLERSCGRGVWVPSAHAKGAHSTDLFFPLYPPRGNSLPQTLLPDRLHGHVPGRAGAAAGAAATLAFLGVLGHLSATGSTQTIAELLIGSFGYLLLRSRSPAANARPPLVPVFAGDSDSSPAGFSSLVSGGASARDNARKRSSVTVAVGPGKGDVEAAPSPREARSSTGEIAEGDCGLGFAYFAQQAQSLSPAGRAAVCFTLVAAANAACEGLLVGAGAHRGSGGGESRVLLPGSLTTLVRGAAVAAGVQSLTRMRSAAMCAVIFVAVAQLVRPVLRPRRADHPPPTPPSFLSSAVYGSISSLNCALAAYSRSLFSQSGSATGVFGVPHFAAKGTIPERALATSVRGGEEAGVQIDQARLRALTGMCLVLLL